VIPESLIIVGLKLDKKETCTSYEVARVDAFHAREGLVETFVAPFEGALNVGTAGVSTCTEKRQTLDHPLVPAEFVAFTRQ
jgi:hypothetical protein